MPLTINNDEITFEYTESDTDLATDIRQAIKDLSDYLNKKLASQGKSKDGEAKDSQLAKLTFHLIPPETLYPEMNDIMATLTSILENARTLSQNKVIFDIDLFIDGFNTLKFRPSRKTPGKYELGLYETEPNMLLWKDPAFQKLVKTLVSTPAMTSIVFDEVPANDFTAIDNQEFIGALIQELTNNPSLKKILRFSPTLYLPALEPQLSALFAKLTHLSFDIEEHDGLALFNDAMLCKEFVEFLAKLVERNLPFTHLGFYSDAHEEWRDETFWPQFITALGKNNTIIHLDMDLNIIPVNYLQKFYQAIAKNQSLYLTKHGKYISEMTSPDGDISQYNYFASLINVRLQANFIANIGCQSVIPFFVSNYLFPPIVGIVRSYLGSTYLTLPDANKMIESTYTKRRLDSSPLYRSFFRSEFSAAYSKKFAESKTFVASKSVDHTNLWCCRLSFFPAKPNFEDFASMNIKGQCELAKDWAQLTCDINTLDRITLCLGYPVAAKAKHPLYDVENKWMNEIRDIINNTAALPDKKIAAIRAVINREWPKFYISFSNEFDLCDELKQLLEEGQSQVQQPALKM